MTRKEWLISTYGEALVKKLSDQGMTFDGASAVNQFMEYDPTRGGRYSQWLISTFMKGGYRFEDLSRARSTLEHFGTFNQRLHEDQRDINRYPALSDVWIAVKPFVEQPAADESLSGKDKRRLERAKAYQESMILVENDDWTVAVPLTSVIEKDPSVFSIIQSAIEYGSLPADLAHKVVRYDGRHLRSFPSKQVGLDLTLETIQKDEFYLNYVHDEFKEAINERMNDLDFRPAWLMDDKFIEGMEVALKLEMDENPTFGVRGR